MNDIARSNGNGMGKVIIGVFLTWMITTVGSSVWIGSRLNEQKDQLLEKLSEIKQIALVNQSNIQYQKENFLEHRNNKGAHHAHAPEWGPR